MDSALGIVLIVLGVLIAWGIILLFVLSYIVSIVQKDERIKKKENNSDCFDDDEEDFIKNE